MTDLSPATQAVSAAAEKAQTHYWELFENGPETDQTEADTIAAAALRAAAERVKLSLSASTPSTDWGEGWKDGARCVAQGLESIATELENTNG